MRDGRLPGRDGDQRVNDFVWRAALVVLVGACVSWIVLSAALVAGRVRYDRRRSGPAELGSRAARRLVQRIEKTPRTQWGRWRRVAALQRLERAHHPAVPRLVRRVLRDADREIASAAIRMLGDDWAIELLVDSLRLGTGPRSRIAAELERLGPAPGKCLVPLLRDRDGTVRFWAATLLGPYPGLADATLVDLTWDSDPNVRDAAVETLGTKSGSEVGPVLIARLEDVEWFVRVHAARALGHVVGAEAAPTVTRLLADERWWVRTAAKDALRGMGTDAIPSLLAALFSRHVFATQPVHAIYRSATHPNLVVVDKENGARRTRGTPP